MNTELQFHHGVAIGAGVMLALQVLSLIGRPWLRALMSHASAPAMFLIGMRLRGNPVNLLVDAHIHLVKSGRSVPLEVVEVVYITNKLTIKNHVELADLASGQWERSEENRKRSEAEAEEG